MEECIYPEKHFSSVSEVIKVLKERKTLYDQMATAFKPTCEYKYFGGGNAKLDIEVDEQAQIICFAKENSKTYFRFSDFININKMIAYPWKYTIQFKIFGKETNILIDTRNSSNTDENKLLAFFDSIKPK
jgi:hypothetical protein